jgi:hypothetical protein
MSTLCRLADAARRTSVLALMLLCPDATRAQGASQDGARAARIDTATVHVARPTVIAYLVVPAGAVDTSADLAVLADDWNVAMATLGDSLEARGILFALATEARLRVRMSGRRDAMLALNEEPAAGYVFVRPGMTPCLRRGAAEPEEVLRTARALLGGRVPREAARRAICGARSR